MVLTCPESSKARRKVPRALRRHLTYSLCLVSASFVQSEHRTVKSPPPAQKSVRNETSRNR